VAPQVTAVQVYSDAACTTVASAITPQVTYYVKVTVSDANTLNDIDEVKIKTYYDATAAHPNESTITAGHEQNACIFTWTKAAPNPTWAFNAGAGSTWGIVAASSVTPTLTAQSGDWVFAIRFGKVATETIAPAVWNFHARATDHAGHSNGLHLWDKQVLWYGQCQVNTPAVNFGEVALGSGFGASTNKFTGVSVTMTANGDFSTFVKSSATWNGSLGNIATLDPTGTCVNNQEFALKAHYEDTYGVAVLVDTTGVRCRDGSQTLEAGQTITTGTFWLKVSTVFPADAYTGTITYTIVNR